jgi:hypothetical protein
MKRARKKMLEAQCRARPLTVCVQANYAKNVKVLTSKAEPLLFRLLLSSEVQDCSSADGFGALTA